MKNCEVLLPRALAFQADDKDVQRELESVEEYLQSIDFGDEETLHVVLLRGIYHDFEKRMTTVIAFVNKLPRSICEIHCKIHFSPDMDGVQIANMTVDFDRDFMGNIDRNEAVLAHFNIPVKGLTEDRDFTNKEIKYSVEDTRVTYVEDRDEEDN
ncbi:MAG: hypothetical protein IKE74_10235 [Mogibacterium sp.]|nr:hypothetical protein [Mogibacterium sp.]